MAFAMFFDNANQMKSKDGVFGIFDYTPRKNVPLILIISQTMEWGKHGIDILEVTELSQEESIEFFRIQFNLTKEQLASEEELEISATR